MTDKARMPRIKEQYKDNAIEVEKYAQSVAEMHKQNARHKEAQYKTNPVAQAEDLAGCPKTGCDVSLPFNERQGGAESARE